MDDELFDELREIARDVAAYAAYAKAIGDDYIGPGPPPRARAPLAPEPESEANVAPRGDGPSLFAEPPLDAGAPDETLDEIRADLGECIRCKLHTTRTHIVFGEGSPTAELMFIGEGPGADEDATGRPFVGAAGKLLDKIIAAIGYTRDEVYIANVVKCRPPGNRKPEKDESSTCQQFLFRQIAAIRPKVIVSLGNTPAEALIGIKGGITRIRGEFYDYHGIKLMPTFHPAYLLRDATKKREVWEDMKKVRELLKGA
jgi:DNA polymerase